MLVTELFARLGLELDEGAFEKGEAAIHGLRHGIIAFGAAAATAAAVGLAAIVKTTANAGDQAKKMGQSTGLGVEAFQELRYAAGLMDLESEELTVGLAAMARKGLKISREELIRLADQFQAMPDGMNKSKLSMEKFGRSGTKWIPLLNKGGEEMRKMFDEAHKVGAVMSKEDTDASEEFNESLRRLGGVVLGFRNRIGVALLRPFTEFIRLLTEGLKALPQFTGLLKILAVTVASLTVAYLALNAASIGAAIASAAAWIVALAPVIALGVAIAAVVLVLQDFYTFMEGGDSIIGRVLDKWKAKFDGLGDSIKSFWRDFHLFESQPDWQTFIREPNGQGGGASPGASVGASPGSPVSAGAVLSPSFKANITINVPPGTDTKDLGPVFTEHLERFWDSKLSETVGGLDHG